MRRATLAVVLLCFITMVPRQVRGDLAAVTLTSPGETYSGVEYTLGFEFSVNQSLTVTALGVYNYDTATGLANPAQVGIWDATGNLLASTTVAAGTGPTLIGDFRYSSITPLTLVTGQDYIVGSYVNDTATSFNTDQGGSGSYDPAINPIQDRFSDFNSSFSFPNDTDGHGAGAWLGGNFLFASTVAVPEPSTMVMVGIVGLIGLGYSWRRQNRTA